MAHYRTSVTTPLDPEAAFGSVADFTTVADWDPGVSRSTRVDSGGLGVGSAFDVDVALGGRNVTFRYEVTEWSAPERCVLRAERGPMVSLDTISVEALPGGGSVVTYDAVLELRGPLRLFDLLLAVGFRRVGDRAAAGLEAHLVGAVRS
jgi:dehydrogenase/reductase SDR family protein 12